MRRSRDANARSWTFSIAREARARRRSGRGYPERRVIQLFDRSCAFLSTEVMHGMSCRAFATYSNQLSRGIWYGSWS